MKRFTMKASSVVLAAVMLFGSAPLGSLGLPVDISLFAPKAAAAELGGSCGSGVRWTLDRDSGVFTVSGNGAMTDYKWDNHSGWSEQYADDIKSVIIGDGVTKIGAYTFIGCSNIESVTIGSAVTSIGVSAFYGCSALTSLTIPDGVTSIGATSFYDCSALTNADLPDSVVEIGSYAFYNCASLTSVTIGPNVTQLGDRAFYGCTSLTLINYNARSVSKKSGNDSWFWYAGTNGEGVDLIFGDTVESFQKDLFYSTSIEAIPKLKTIVIGAGISEIEDGTFSGFPLLTSVVIGDGVTSIGNFAFQNCPELSSVTFGKNVTSISNVAFYGCKSLRNVKLPDSLTTLGREVFWYCTGLESVELGKSLATINENTFQGCTGLTSVTVPKTVTSIKQAAFKECSALKHIFYNGTPEDWSGISVDNYYNYNNAIVTARNYDEYDESFEGAWIHFVGKHTITFDTKGGSEIDPITADYGTEITKPTDPTKTGYIFAGWDKVIPDTMPDEDLTITAQWAAPGGACGDDLTWTYDHTSGELRISGHGDMADYSFNVPAPWFKYRGLITSITLSDDVTTIGDCAFRALERIQTVSIPNGVTSIGEDAFFDCYGLTDISIPDTVTSIGKAAFAGCRELSEITIPDSVTHMGNEVFYDCKGLKDVVIPDKVTAIGDWMFFCCTGLTSVTIPENVMTIGALALSGCTSLSDVYYKGTQKQWRTVFIDEYNESLLNATIHYLGLYELVYDANGGSNAPEAQTGNGIITLSEAVPVLEGHTFIGWKRETDDAQYRPGAAFDLSDDIRLYALWQLNSHTITFDTKGGNEIAPITADYGTAIVKPADPKREGFSFTGWDKTIPDTMPDKDLIITATWAINPHTITFDTKGGNKIDPITADYGTAIEKPVDPKREGYTFTGWDKPIPDTIPDEDLIITATWAIDPHTITFDTKGGNEIASITADYGTAIEKPADPKREGYTFTGWDKAIPDTMPDEDLTITATWKINSHTITFDTKGGNEIAPITADYGTEIERPADPKREGFSFTGWDKIIPDTMPDEDLTITATWAINPHTITFDTKGGSKINPITADYGTAIEKPADPKREGYSFTGWDKTIPETMPDEDLTINATWAINPHTITFDTKGGNKIDPITADYGTAIEKPADPKREGYSFTGWDKTIPDTMPDEDLTITATWKINSHTITFDTKGGNKIDPITADYGTEIVKPADPKRDGYTFTGWDKIIPDTMPDEDLTITATWKINSHTITFDTKGGNKIEPITADYGTVITKPADPKCEGYTFTGWDKTIPDTMPDEDLTITANWRINSHTITFDTKGGSKIDPITADYGTEIVKPADPKREGYSFTGWDKAIPDTMPDEDLTITATWKINSHTITFDTKGGSKIDPITADYGTAIEKPADPKREGYTFTGWDKTIPDTMPDEDLTITATWKLIGGECGEDLTWSFDQATGTLRITGRGAMADYASPSETPWSEYGEEIRSIVIGDGVTSIGDNAFRGLGGITSVTVPKNVTSIGASAFAGCVGLKELYYDAATCSGGGMTASPGSHWLAGCGALKSLTVGDDVKMIPAYAFYDLDGLTSVIIPGGVSSVGSYAFGSCDKLTTVLMEDGVSSIGDRAFTGSESLRNIALPDSVKNIGSEAFYATAFYNDRSNWIDGVLYSGKHLIRCDTAKSGDCEIRTGTVNVASGAFGNCSGITGVIIPASVTDIAALSFNGCDKLTDVYYYGGESGWNDINVGAFNASLTAAVRHYPAQAAPVAPTCVSVGKTACTYWSGTAPIRYILPPDDIAPLGHDFVRYVYDDNATTKADGTETARCERCDETHTRTVPGTRLKCVKTDDENRVTVEYYDGVFGTEDDDALSVEANEIENKDAKFSSFKANVDGEQIALYEVHMVDVNGEHVQPKESQRVEVRLQLPEGFEVKDPDRLYIHHRRFDGRTERIKYSTGALKIENGCFVFEVDSFSEFAVCSLVDFNVNIAAQATAKYGSRVIVTVTADGLPEGYRLVMTVDGKVIEGDGEKVTYVCDRIKGDINYTVKVIDREGDTASFADGGKAAKTGTVTCKTNIFIRIGAFFRKLFGIVRTIEIKP